MSALTQSPHTKVMAKIPSRAAGRPSAQPPASQTAQSHSRGACLQAASSHCQPLQRKRAEGVALKKSPAQILAEFYCQRLADPQAPTAALPIVRCMKVHGCLSPLRGCPAPRQARPGSCDPAIYTISGSMKSHHQGQPHAGRPPQRPPGRRSALCPAQTPGRAGCAHTPGQGTAHWPLPDQLCEPCGVDAASQTRSSRKK